MRAIAISSGIVLSFSGASAFSNVAPSAPVPSAPVISGPIKPGECVVACVPGSGGGGITIGGTAPGGAGGTVTIGGGSTSGGCQLYCNPPTPPTQGGGGGGNDNDPCRMDKFFGCTMESR